MNVVLIGCDLTGKTTLHRNLQELFESANIQITAEYVLRKEGEVLLHDILDYYDRFRSEENLILDRFHYPDNPLYKRSFNSNVVSAISGYELAIEKELNDLDVIFIYLYAPIDVLYDRFDKRGDDLVVKGDIHNILREYNKFLQSTTLNVFQFNSGILNEEELLYEVANLIIGYYDLPIEITKN